MSNDVAYKQLLRVLSEIPADQVVSVDSFRDATDAAQLTSAEKSGSLTKAMNAGYLSALVAHDANGDPYLWHGRRVLGCVASDREQGKGGRVLLYVRTDAVVPEHLCQGTTPSVVPSSSIVPEQLPESCDTDGSKTAPAGNRGLTIQTGEGS